jgi:hypothetical protein
MKLDTCQIAELQDHNTTRVKNRSLSSTLRVFQSRQPTPRWYSCSSSEMNKRKRSSGEQDCGTESRCFFGSILHGIIDSRLSSASSVEHHVYSTSDIFNSVFAALTPPVHLSSFFSQSTVCIALERKMSALKLARRLHFPARASISDCDGNVFSKALCLIFWIYAFCQ